MTTALIILIILGILLTVAYVQREKILDAIRGTQPAKETPKPNPTVTPFRDPFRDRDSEQKFWDLKAPDVVAFDGENYFVRKTIANEVGGYEWFEHLLESESGSKFWLSVENDEGLDLGVWNPIDMVDVRSGKVGDESVVILGKAYKHKENGGASWRYVNSDDTGSGVMTHHQYEAADGTMLAFQRYDGGDWQGTVGRRVRPSEFDIYPATV